MPALFVSYSGHFGGGERLLLDYASALEGECVLACPEGPLAGRAASAGLRVVPLREHPLELRGSPRAGVAAALALGSHAREARRLVRDLAPDLLLAWGMRSAIALGGLPLGGARPPRTVFQHNDLLPGAAVGRLVRAGGRALRPRRGAVGSRGPRSRPHRRAGRPPARLPPRSGPGALPGPPAASEPRRGPAAGRDRGLEAPRPRARGGCDRGSRPSRAAPPRGRRAARRPRRGPAAPPPGQGRAARPGGARGAERPRRRRRGPARGVLPAPLRGQRAVRAGGAGGARLRAAGGGARRRRPGGAARRRRGQALSARRRRGRRRPAGRGAARPGAGEQARPGGPAPRRGAARAR